jgi:hypothetical protein
VCLRFASFAGVQEAISIRNFRAEKQYLMPDSNDR